MARRRYGMRARKHRRRGGRPSRRDDHLSRRIGLQRRAAARFREIRRRHRIRFGAARLSHERHRLPPGARTARPLRRERRYSAAHRANRRRCPEALRRGPFAHHAGAAFQRAARIRDRPRDRAFRFRLCAASRTRCERAPVRRTLEASALPLRRPHSCALRRRHRANRVRRDASRACARRIRRQESV